MLEWELKKKNIKLYDIQGRKEVRQADQIIGWCRLEDGSVLLDIACGTGDPAREIAAKHSNVEVVGIDITKTQIRQGKDWASEDGLANIHFVVGDVDYLPFKEGVFDTATCVGAFQHFPNPLNTLCETARVLKIRGRLVLSTVLVPEDEEGYDFINKLSRLGVFPGACLGYPSKSELERMLKACGFESKLDQKDAENWKGDSKQPALAGKEVADAARSAPPQLKQRFKVEVRGEKVFLDYPGPLVVAIGEKIQTASVSQDFLKPRYLLF